MTISGGVDAELGVRALCVEEVGLEELCAEELCLELCAEELCLELCVEEVDASSVLSIAAEDPRCPGSFVMFFAKVSYGYGRLARNGSAHARRVRQFHGARFRVR